MSPESLEGPKLRVPRTTEEVASPLAGKLLEGQRIVVTRASHQSEALIARLKALGANTILLPTIGIEALTFSLPPIAFDWIVFTSANAVTPFQAADFKPELRVAAIGPGTAAAAVRHGFDISVIADEFVAEGLAKNLSAEHLAGCNVLLPRAAVTRDVIAASLQGLGAHVTSIAVYRNFCPDQARIDAALIFREPFPDWALFASPSAFRNLVAILPGNSLTQTKLLSIGPVTSEAIRAAGFVVAAEADPHTVDGMIATLSANGSDLNH